MTTPRIRIASDVGGTFTDNLAYDEDAKRITVANVRTPEERRGDLNAQLAALRVGEQRLVELAHRYGIDLVTTRQVVRVGNLDLRGRPRNQP